MAPSRVLTDPFMYSTSSAAECASPKPALTVMYGSTPMSLQRVMNSSMPTSLVCIAFQAWSNIGGRLSMSPTESYQLQLERKLPPGRRQKPEWSWRSREVVSGRNPCMLSEGINESVPMWKFPVPVPVISIEPFSVSDFAVKLRGNFLYSLVSDANEVVCRSFLPSPQISATCTRAPGVPQR